jgi:phosphate transport system substrate-binding protein
MRKLTLLLTALALVPAVLAAGCGGDDDDEAAETGAELSGRIAADGSSTVGPLTTAAAERFQRENSGVQVTVGVSGTGGGFERFCAGETDLSNASRAIDDEEKQACESKGVEYTELQVANDALTVVVNPQNDWVDCLTVEQLKKIWDRGSKVNNWNQVDPQFSDERLQLFGAGTDSGTFDYFTDVINGEEGRSRSDYSATEDDNVTVEGVAGDKGAMGYFGLSYFQQNSDRLKALEVDGGSGCVAPSVETAQSGEYKPLSRPLFIYAKNESLQRPEVKAFLQYLLDNQQEIAESAQFVPLEDDQLQKSKDALSQAGAA